MRQLGVSPFPLDEMQVHHRIPSMKQHTQHTQHEATKSITTPPGWDASTSQGTQHEATKNITTPPG